MCSLFNDTLHTALGMLCCTKGSWKRAAVYLEGGQPIHKFLNRDHPTLRVAS